MRKVFLGVAAALIVAGGVAVALRGRGAQWSTSNPQALAHFRDGLEASMKYYRAEARRCFAKAAEADPSFLVAKAFLLDHLDPRGDREGAAALRGELEKASVEALPPRERFIVERVLAATARDHAQMRTLTEAFLARYPDDPFGLFFSGQDAVLSGDLGTAKRAFERLVDIAPNWVMAYNHLGYIAMAEGKLDDAERMFATYRFIAPDQANPHDSLGELLLLTGRLDEAEREFELAIQARLDFQPSYENLIRLEALRGNHAGVEAALFRARESGAVPEEILTRLGCWARGWLAARDGDWHGVADLAEHQCSNALPLALALRAALFTGRRALETQTAERLAKYREAAAGAAAGKRELEAIVHELEGIRAAWEGELERAAELFRSAAAAGSFWGFARGFQKLCALSAQAKALQQLGRPGDAAAVTAALRAVNPLAHEMLGKATDLPSPPPS
jgi:Flp pilus assembly protein TadD